MANYTVRVVFNKGITGKEYIFPYVYFITDPKEGIKATVIEGTRGDGVIVIPGGKKSQTITIRGRLIDSDGYADLTTLINQLKAMITTNQGILTLEHWNGSSWIPDWEYTVRRIDEIDFPESLRTFEQEYNVKFLVINY